MSAVFETLAGGAEDAGSRVGLASLLRTVWGADYVDERDARFINDRVHANVQKDSSFSTRAGGLPPASSAVDRSFALFMPTGSS